MGFPLLFIRFSEVQAVVFYLPILLDIKGIKSYVPEIFLAQYKYCYSP